MVLTIQQLVSLYLKTFIKQDPEHVVSDIVAMYNLLDAAQQNNVRNNIKNQLINFYNSIEADIQTTASGIQNQRGEIERS